MKNTTRVSNAVIRRLPRYLRILDDLINRDVDRISSGELSERIGYTASQIRQDLNHFGGFGQQGYGYNVKDLRQEIQKILGLTNEYRLVIVGCGKLGRAIANYTYFYQKGFPIVGMFDINPDLIGTDINGITVMDALKLPLFLKKNEVDIGIITVTRDEAQGVAEKLRDGAVKGIWNFAPTDLSDMGDIQVENVHLLDGLQSLVYYINHPE